eukprot:9075787-Prorocentrum_lima.AAC.1
MGSANLLADNFHDQKIMRVTQYLRSIYGELPPWYAWTSAPPFAGISEVARGIRERSRIN